MFWLSQIYPIVIMAGDMLIAVFYRKTIGYYNVVSLLSYGVLPIIAMTVQIFVYGITFLYLATTLSLLIIYIVVQMEQNKRIELQRLELAQANIVIMFSRIQPHFFV